VTGANASDDVAMYRWTSEVLSQVSAEAKSRGLCNSFIYMNHAGQFQVVISSYGTESKTQLKEVAKIYDPTGVFRKL
jgi:hypothetical protein